MKRHELLCLKTRERQLDEQIKDIEARMNRYEPSKQRALLLTMTRLEQRLGQVRYTLRLHETDE
jgi:hypothetical protein